MSNVNPQFATVEKKRPSTVTTAAAIQLIVAALTILGTVLSMVYSDDMAQAMRDELAAQGVAPAQADQFAGDGGTNLIGILVPLALTLVYAALAFLNLRGSRPARITTWVFSGVLLLCNAGLLAIASMATGEVEGVNLDRMIEAGYAAVPGWFNVLQTLSAVVALVGYVLVIVLLALPASNKFFAKEEPQLILPTDQA